MVFILFSFSSGSNKFSILADTFVDEIGKVIVVRNLKSMDKQGNEVAQEAPCYLFAKSRSIREQPNFDTEVDVAPKFKQSRVVGKVSLGPDKHIIGFKVRKLTSAGFREGGNRIDEPYKHDLQGHLVLVLQEQLLPFLFGPLKDYGARLWFWLAEHPRQNAHHYPP